MSQTEKKIDPKQQQAWKAWAKYALDALIRHPVLKLCSLFIAVLLWSVLIASDGTLTREKSFPNVEVTVVGQDALRARGMVVMEDVSALLPTVKVKAEVSQAAFDRVTSAGFTPRIDLSRLTQIGEQEVQITVGSTISGTVTAIDPPTIKLTVERYITRTRVPVVALTTGDLPRGLWADTPRVDPQMVSVSGPAQLVEKVARIVAPLDRATLTGETTPERMAVPFVLEDAHGVAIDASQLRVTYEGVILTSAIVETSCYPEAEQLLDIRSAVVGKPAEGYELADVLSEPDSVRIAADADDLAAETRMLAESPINIDGATDTVIATVRIKRPNDVKHMSVEEATITAVIREKTEQRVFRAVPVAIEGLDDGYAAKLSQSKLSMTIGGPFHWVTELKEADVYLSVSAAGLQPGTYAVPVKIAISNAPDHTEQLEQTELTLTITGK